jgi:acyl carrier protein
LAPDAHLSELGIDSLGMLELMFKIEDNFHLKIPGDTPTDLVTVQDVCTYIEGLIADQQSAPESTQKSAQGSAQGSALSPDVES